jgi:hypothetical protein
MRNGRTSVGLAAAALLALSACVPAAPSGERAARPAPARMAVAGGAVTVGGPSGYCVDPGASREGPGGAFVLLGSCASISGSFTALRPKRPGILTASVAPGSGDETFAAAFPSMARFLASPAGRAALSRTGKAETVEIVTITSAGDVMYVHARDGAPGQEVEADYWRALMAVNGQIVTLSVLGLRDKPVPPEAKLALLESFVKKVRALNGLAQG